MIFLFPIQKWYCSAEEPKIGYRYVSPSFPMPIDGIYNSVYDEDELYTTGEQEVKGEDRRTEADSYAVQAVAHDKHMGWLIDYPSCYDIILPKLVCTREKLPNADRRIYALCVEDNKWVYISNKGVPMKLSIEEFENLCKEQPIRGFYYKPSFKTVSMAGYELLVYKRIPKEAILKYVDEIKRVFLKAKAIGVPFDNSHLTETINTMGEDFLFTYNIKEYDYLPVYVELWKMLVDEENGVLKAIRGLTVTYEIAFAVTFDLKVKWSIFDDILSYRTYAIATTPIMPGIMEVTGVSKPLFGLDIDIMKKNPTADYYNTYAFGKHFVCEQEGKPLWLLKDPLLYASFDTMRVSELKIIGVLCEELDLSKVQVDTGEIGLADCKRLKTVKVKSKATRVETHACNPELKILYSEE